MKIREIEAKINRLQEWRFDARILKLANEILKEREPEIKKLRAELERLRNARPKKKPRWPENTPENVLKVCQKYWSGTSEHATFRIHLWNDKAVWTSYPAGGYSTNGGWNPTSAHYDLLSLTKEVDGLHGKKPKILKSLSFERCSGKRVTPAMMQEELDKL